MRTLASLLALAIALTTAAGCFVESDDDAEAGEDELKVGGVTEAVEKKLRVTHPREQGKTWVTTKGNALPGNWLLQVPAASTWGSSDLLPGHSDAVLGEIHDVMTKAEYSLDVASLWAPTGRFLDTMRNALTELGRSGKRIVARFLFADYPGYDPQIDKTLAELTRDLRGTNVSVSVAKHQRTAASWNHSKIIAVDGREAIIGGMNLNSAHYLDAEPVHDVSLHVAGPVASAAQNYVNELWAVPCGKRGAIRGTKNDHCPPAFAPRSTEAVGNVQMMAVGRLGNVRRNPADDALVAMIDAASSKIRISQQDLASYPLPGSTFPDDVFDAFSRAARKGKDVTVILTNEGAFGGTGRDKADGYSNSASLEKVWKAFKKRQKQVWPNEDAAVCKHVRFATLRMSARASWASGSPLANHAKIVIADDKAHYVGSQNLYKADLAEFGVIVDDQTATRQFISEYWDKLAQHSLTTEYRPRECQ